MHGGDGRSEGSAADAGHRRLFAMLIALAAIVVSLFAVAGAQAANFTVTTTTDSNDGSCTPSTCSLRDAVIAANSAAGDDTITVPGGHYLLTIAGSGEDAAATGDLDIVSNGAVTLTGAGARSTIIDASGLGDRVFEVLPGATATISGVTVTGGHVADQGGGIRNDGVLTVANSMIQGNTNTGSFDGGGIWTNGAAASLTITGSTISGNTTDEYGGGLDLEGGATTVTNSTLIGNTSTGAVSGGGDGGGADIDTGGTVQFTNDTIDQNASNNGPAGGVWDGAGTTPNVFFQNTIVADNTSSTAGTANCDTVQPASASNPGNNLDSDSSCFSGPNDKHAEPLLGPLQDNGGPTDTQALGAGSPALDAGDNSVCPTTDQRGVPRPQGAACDIGAFEAAGADLSLAKAAPASVPVGSNITYTLQASDNGPGPATGVTVTDHIPAGTSFVSATPSKGSCSGTATVTCQLGVLDKGDAPTMSIVVKTTTGGTFKNTATVSGNEPDPAPANNSASVTTTALVAPVVVTGAAGAIAANSAIVTGSVNDGNLPATYVFQYGLTNSYGLKSTVTPLAAGPGVQAVNAALAGLQAGKTYHYRLVAVSAGGSTNGADMTFTTRSGARRVPRAVTVHVTPRHARFLPYRFTFTGRLVLPSGVTAGQGCKGSVSIRIKAGTKTVFNRRARISSKCTYRLRVSFGQPKRLGTSGRLRVTPRFSGNGVLTRKSPRSFFVFFG